MVVPGPAVLIDDQVWPALQRLAKRKSRGRATVVVPYVTEALLDLRAGDTLAVDLSPATLAAGQTNPAVLGTYLKAGVRLCSSPGLHAKVFILGNRAVVGSSNMSKSSQQVLREAVVVLDDPSAVKAAAAAATRLLGPDIGLADLNAAASLYRPPARTPQRPLRPSGKHPAGEPPGPRDRLWVVGLYADEWPVTATNKATAAQRGIRRRAGRAADVEIESALWDLDEAPKLKLDDVVIEAWAPGKHDPLAVAMHPARVIEILNVAGRGRSRGWVIAYWRRPTGTTTRTWSELRHAAARGGVRLTDKRPIARRITKPRAHAELRKLWAKGRVNRASD